MDNFDLKKLAGEFTDVERARLYFADFHRRHWGDGKCVLSGVETTLLKMMTNKGVLSEFANLYGGLCELARDVIEEYQSFELNFHRLGRTRYQLVVGNFINGTFLSLSAIDQHTDDIGKVFSTDLRRFLSQLLVLEYNVSDNTLVLKEDIAVFVKERVKEMFDSACKIKTMKVIADKVFSELGINHPNEEKSKLSYPSNYLESVEAFINQHNTIMLETTSDIDKECKHYLQNKEWVTYQRNLLSLNDYIIQAPKVDEALYAQLEAKLFKKEKK